MNNCRTVNGTAARLFVVSALLCGATCASGACDPPRHQVVRTWLDKAPDLGINISIRLADLAPARLICLAGELKREYPGRNITASIFTSREAAMGYRPGSMEVPPKVLVYQSKFHAHYFYNMERREEYLRISPNGHTADADPGISTRIDLPVTGAPVCRLAVGDRCLLEFQHIYPPSFESKRETSGQVTLAGSIGRNGALSDVAVVDAKADPPERESALVGWAKHNFTTWHFEPARHKDAMRITYYFEVVDPSIRSEYGVLFRLPDEVRILVGRSE